MNQRIDGWIDGGWINEYQMGKKMGWWKTDERVKDEWMSK